MNLMAHVEEDEGTDDGLLYTLDLQPGIARPMGLGGVTVRSFVYGAVAQDPDAPRDNSWRAKALKKCCRSGCCRLPPPIQTSDALSHNLPAELKTIASNCLAHGRRHLVDIIDNFPDECSKVLETLKYSATSSSFTLETMPVVRAPIFSHSPAASAWTLTAQVKPKCRSTRVRRTRRLQSQPR